MSVKMIKLEIEGTDDWRNEHFVGAFGKKRSEGFFLRPVHF